VFSPVKFNGDIQQQRSISPSELRVVELTKTPEGALGLTVSGGVINGAQQEVRFGIVVFFAATWLIILGSVDVYTHARTHTHTPRTHVRTHTHTHAQMHTHTHTHTHTYIHR
jgi:hypothetical protein